GTPKTLKEFLFLVLFLLDKGEKVRLSDLKSKRAVAFLHGLGVNATVPGKEFLYDWCGVTLKVQLGVMCGAPVKHFRIAII
ncbi:MAG: hypothetical protein IKQ92_06835, partial [Clostridia bacterium]|nr:hypothetical protein [Clostridia bacterium]